MVYMCCTFIIMQPALSCPEQNLRRCIDSEPLLYVSMNVCTAMGGDWLAASLADGRTCGCATPRGPSLCLRRRRGPWREWWMGGSPLHNKAHSPPSSSSGMQLTWDGHVRLVCVCVCA